MEQKNHPFGDEHFAKLLMEMAPVGMLISDVHGSIVAINAQSEAWFGYTRDEILGKPVEVLVPITARAGHAKHRGKISWQKLNRSMLAGQDLMARRKDGSEFPVDISLHPIETESGAMILANILDASDRLQAKVRRKAMQTERLAAVGEMATGLAHQSRNALQRARACLDLLDLDVQEDSEQTQLVSRIRRALDDLQHDYEEVKQYAAPMVLNYCHANLFELCEQAFADLIATQHNGDHRLTTVGTDGIAIAKVDPYRMMQLFRNVLENSLMAAPDGVELITTATTTMFQGETALEIEIKDNGEGLDPQTSLRLFEPFYTTKQHGTGLGLAICRRIAEAHDGRIHASNHPQGGTVVEVVVPKRL